MFIIKIKVIFYSIIVLLLLVAFIIVVFMNVRRPKVYAQDYFIKLGITKNRNYDKNDMINDFGNPLSIEKSIDYTNFVYEKVYFQSLDEKNSEQTLITQVFITSEDLRFGEDNIGIGSKKEDVIYAYKKASILISIDRLQSLSFKDNGFYITYYFNDNNTVNKIGIGFNT